MRKTTFFRSLLAAVMLLVGTSAVWSAEETYTYTNGDGVSVEEGLDRTYKSANFTFLHKKNTSTSAIAPIYPELRVYSGHSMEVYPTVAGKTINSIEVTTGSASYATAMSNATILAGTSVGTATAVAGIAVINGNGVTFDLSGVAGCEYVQFVLAAQSRTLSWKVTYGGSGGPITPTPSIIVTEVVVPQMTAEVNASSAKTISVSGSNLTANISVAVSGANANYFSVAPATLTQVSGSVSATDVVVTYAPLAAGTHTASLTFSSAGASDVVRSLTGMTTTPPVQGEVPNVIITEVYGGGGNSGATLKNDFIELYNTTSSAVNIGGWSVQYFSGTGTTHYDGNTGVIPEGKMIPANGYFLIQGIAGTGGTVDLPAPDATTTLAMGGTAGKIILYTTAEDQTISATDIVTITGNPAFKDYVPYGTTATPVWGSAMAANTTNTTSAQRKRIGGVYSYTQNIGADFEVGEPTPSNSLMSSVITPEMLKNVVAMNGTIRFEATAGQLVEVYNVIGHKLVSKLAKDGYNIIPLKEKGIMMVKIGNKVSKVIL